MVLGEFLKVYDGFVKIELDYGFTKTFSVKNHGLKKEMLEAEITKIKCGTDNDYDDLSLVVIKLKYSI